MIIFILPALFIFVVTWIIVNTFLKRSAGVKLAIAAVISIAVSALLFWLFINAIGRFGC